MTFRLALLSVLLLVPVGARAEECFVVGDQQWCGHPGTPEPAGAVEARMRARVAQEVAALQPLPASPTEAACGSKTQQLEAQGLHEAASTVEIYCQETHDR